MNSELKTYIEQNIELIEQRKYQAVYRGLDSYLRGELTEVLHKAGIHPEQYLTYIPILFAKQATIQSAVLADDCFSIGASAFKASTLEKIHLNNKLELISDEAFAFCSELRYVNIPNSVHTLMQDAFFGCTKLEDVKLSNTLNVLDNFVFSQCQLLTQLTIPVSVVDIREGCFAGSYRLKTLTYEGTKKQWVSIHKDPNWNAQSNINKIVCTDGTINIK